MIMFNVWSLNFKILILPIIPAYSSVLKGSVVLVWQKWLLLVIVIAWLVSQTN